MPKQHTSWLRNSQLTAHRDRMKQNMEETWKKSMGVTNVLVDGYLKCLCNKHILDYCGTRLEISR